MRTRNWSIRSKIIALAAVPLTALLALWLFATTLTAGPAMNLLSANTLLDTVGNPGEVLVGELQRERRLSVQFLSGDRDAVPRALTAQRAATDRAAADFRHGAAGADAQQAAGDTLRTRIGQILGDLDALPANRAYIDRREVDPIGAYGLYNGIVDSAFQMFSALATFNDERVDREIRALTSIGRGREYLARTDALLAGAFAAGRFSTDGRDQLVMAITTSRFLLGEGVHALPAEERTAYQNLSTGEAFTRLRANQDTLMRQSRPEAPVPVNSDVWQPGYDTSVQQLRAFELNATEALADRTLPVAMKILIRLAGAGLLGLIALVVSGYVSVRVGRSIVGRLHRLRGEALEMAGARLPSVVGRLQRGEAVDVDVETPPLEYGRDEIGQVGRAFNEVQRTAVQSAVEEANVRRGINEVFLNIARRSQTLLHRQLALLDRMERRETEPAELEDLYRVDHLATRMRRHAEDLVILAGAAPGRGWRNPVPVVDVVRGAISEVEDYKRIDILSIETSAVLGRAVGDVIHLVAELLENAASFSPPHTRVQVLGQVLPNGYALEIEDRGLGMPAEAIEEANRKLAEPPDFDPSDSARLGLFVVSQLAHRQHIRVSLRASAYGGITAVVLIPVELITAGPGPMALPAGPSPADRSWDRPPVGTGNQEPARRSLAALQREGGEPVRSVTATGQPVTINGTATDHTPAVEPARGAAGPALPRQRTPLGGPAPSEVADRLTADGLVQRRRTAPRRGPAETESATQAPLDSADSVRTQPIPMPADPIPTQVEPAPDTAPTEDGLPRRVRQASLAPQLRETPVDEQTTRPLRSPEQVRNLMSALQRGTTRGRLAAAGIGPDPDPGAARDGRPGTDGPPGPDGPDGTEEFREQDFREAATVTLPVIRDRTGSAGNGARDRPGGTDPGSTTTTTAAGDRGDQPEENDVTRPDKDA